MLSSRECLELLFESGSMEVTGPAGWPDRGADAADVVTAIGRVDGRRVACYAQDGLVAGGSVGGAQAEAIVRLLRLAGATGAPVVSFVQSAGARIQDGVGGLAGLGRIFAENVRLLGRVAQISVVTGPTAGGGAYSTALTDFVVMTQEAAMFLTGPCVVSRACGENLSPAALGGAGVHAGNGVCHLVAGGDAEAISLARSLLAYLAPDVGPVSGVQATAAVARDPGDHLPARRGASYDIRDIVGCIVDRGELLELSPRWARNVFTAFARIGGIAAGVVANQPRHLGGVLDVEGSEKAARFVGRCDAHGLPIIVLVDTPGFMPGSKQERAGIIFRGARLVEAFARATVPRFTVVLRKAYGGAYIAMNAKQLGATATFAWPEAEIGIMDARQAIGLVHRRELAAAADAEQLAATLAAGYAEAHCRASSAAQRGFIDRVIAPGETRGVLWRSLLREVAGERLAVAASAGGGTATGPRG